MAGSEQPVVALSKGHIQAVCQGEDEFRAGPGLSELDETEMAGGHAGTEREIQLAEMRGGSLLAYQLAHGRHRHDPDLTRQDV